MPSSGGDGQQVVRISLPTLPAQPSVSARYEPARTAKPPTGAPIRPNIAKVSRDGFPREHWNTVRYWGFFSREEITREAGKLLMLDIDFGRECSLRCPTCFRRRNAVDDSEDPDLTYDELLDVLRQARELGLRCVKICGAGEPFENPDLLRLARTLTGWGVGLSIFTKGHVLGDDAAAARVFAHEGVTSGRDLAERLFELDTSVLVSFQSFHPEVQDRLVGNVPGHTLRRNRAVELLAEIGFNKCSPTRMALCANPITRDNYDELFDIYVYARERHILPVIAALMVSGKQFSKPRFLERMDVSDEEKVRLWTRIYEYNIEQGIQTLEEIREDGVSAMPGIHPCNQIAHGVYLTANGAIMRCPGARLIQGRIRSTGLPAAWGRVGSLNCWRFNCHCPPKAGATIPRELYFSVIEGIHTHSPARSARAAHRLIVHQHASVRRNA